MNKPRVFAIYLPQFYETRNNSKWWGEGFTDWVSVKAGRSIFDGHYQPREPIDDNYYDLSDIDAMRRQVEIAKEYGIDGFVFYHYYFGNNDLELQIPAENYLKNTDIDFPFCFSWANESWVRTWSNISGNVWGEKYDNSIHNSDDGILKLQKYGDRDDWNEHFRYLLPFFRDDRYYKIDNKPVFIIYAADRIPCLKNMIECWRGLAESCGMDGLYIIGSNSVFDHGCLDALVYNEPAYCMSRMRDKGWFEIRNGVTCFDYKIYWDEVLCCPPIVGCKTYYSCACGYDTTPRRGAHGECFSSFSVDVFYEGLCRLIQKSVNQGVNTVFVDAWNEWGEGMYLEADKKYGYELLSAVKKAKEQEYDFSVDSCSQEIMPEYLLKTIRDNEFEIEKYRSQCELLFLWLAKVLEGGNTFSEFFSRNKVNEVAIYGYSDLGRLLHKQLSDDGVVVKYIIDRYVSENSEGLPVFRVEQDLPYVDMIILTIPGGGGVKELVERKYSGRVTSIWNLFEEV